MSKEGIHALSDLCWMIPLSLVITAIVFWLFCQVGKRLPPDGY